MNSGKFLNSEVAFQGDDEERSQQPERDDDEEDEFIEVSILDGLSIEELPPPTTLFREEDDNEELIEVSIFGNPPEREHPLPPTQSEERNVRRKVKEEDSVSPPVLPNPPQLDAKEDEEDGHPSFSFKEEQEQACDDGGEDIESSLEFVSPKVEEDEEEVTKNPEPVIPHLQTRDEEFKMKEEEEVDVGDSDSEYIPPLIPKESNSESDEEESEKKRRPPTRKKKKKKKRKPCWTSPQFPSEKDDGGEFYCADCDRGNDITHCRNCGRKCWRWCEGEKCENEGYFESSHKCFKSLRRNWNSDLFPSEKNVAGDFYCADCERGNDVNHCRNCERRCWRWCDGDECEEENGYKYMHHKCFKSKKKRKNWRREDFPQKKEGNHSCGDCQSSNEKQRCSECGKWCWNWCKRCGEYRTKSHFPCTRKKKKRKKRKREEKKNRKRSRETRTFKKEKKIGVNFCF